MNAEQLNNEATRWAKDYLSREKLGEPKWEARHRSLAKAYSLRQPNI